jgi:hypothetical protein
MPFSSDGRCREWWRKPTPLDTFVCCHHHLWWKHSIRLQPDQECNCLTNEKSLELGKHIVLIRTRSSSGPPGNTRPLLPTGIGKMLRLQTSQVQPQCFQKKPTGPSKTEIYPYNVLYNSKIFIIDLWVCIFVFCPVSVVRSLPDC